MDPRIADHVRQLNRCNQRGGRMLSIRDLIDAGTLDRETSAYLLASISLGSSFLVGAKPGGAGKTTVMVALLNFIPDIGIIPTESPQTIAEGMNDPEAHCYLAHEIGHGSWYAYIWGNETVDFLKLASRHMIASNLHADNLSEVLATPGFDRSNIGSVDLLLFVRVLGFPSRKRRVSSVLEYRGGGGGEEYAEVFAWDEGSDRFQARSSSRIVDEARREWAREVIDGLLEEDLRTIEEVRPFILAALPSAPPSM